LSPGTQATQGQGRILAGSDDQVQPGWQIFEKKDQSLMNFLGFN
jgi:hypothetical protein